jgi:hypothetical protein
MPDIKVVTDDCEGVNAEVAKEVRLEKLRACWVSKVEEEKVVCVADTMTVNADIASENETT